MSIVNPKTEDESIDKMIADSKQKSNEQTGQQLMKFAMDNKKLHYMRERWQDEKQYEDFSEYQQIIKDIFTTGGYEVKKITKGFKITILKDSKQFTVGINLTGVTVSF